MSRDAPLVGKLKECIQEAVVFLRTLGDFKIPAVVERRRKELLVKLEDIQGDTRREKPPKFEESPEKEAKTPPVVRRASQSKIKDTESTKSERSSTPSTVTSPTRRVDRDSKLVNNLVSGFETLHAEAKKEEVDQTPAKKWQVELRKTKKPSDFPQEEKNLEQAKEEINSKDDAEKTNESLQESMELKPNAHRGSTHSLDSTGSNEPTDATPKGGKKKSKLQAVGGLFKRRGRDKSPAPTRKEIQPIEPEPESTPTENAKEEGVEGGEVEAEPEPEEVEEGVRVSGKLEHKVKSRLHTKYVMKDTKLKETTLYIGDKETVTMLGCTVQSNDSGFELFSHSTQKAYTFRVTEGGAEIKEKWVTAIQAAIDEVTPKEEETSVEPVSTTETVPEIQVSEPVASSPAPEATNDSSKGTKRRESKALEVKKPVKTLPTQEVIKGYIHRKKPGLGSRWEKTYCVVTHTAMYFTEVEGNSEYEHMFRVVAGEAVFSEKDKGHDKNSKSIAVKMGKKTEQLSIDKKEFDNWWRVLQQAYCFGESLEFNDEEDDIIPEEAIDEDLYEDVGAIPPVPNSPRPSRPIVQEVAPEDDIMIDEDIYEDTDDFLPPVSEYQLPVASSAPRLPDRNQPPVPLGAPKLPDRNPVIPQPALPPRNALPTQPSLPPRNTGPPLPGRGQLPSKPSAPIPPTNADDEDLYDDVVVGGGEPIIDEDTYDDVVVGGGADEENYDDIAAPGTEPITEEFYEDMAPGESSPQEDYMIMEHGDAESDGELYVDIEPEPLAQAAPSPTPPKVTSSSPPNAKPRGTSTFSRMFAGRKTSTVQTIHSGQVSYRAPKKTKFEERYATVEDVNLLVYKTSSDKKHQEKLLLTECALELGSTEAGAGQYALRVTKGGKVYHFSFKSREDQDSWVNVLKKLVKYAPVDLGEQQVYQTTQDHIAEADDQLTFKKGSFIRLISKDNEIVWYGQLGNEAHIFDGKTGKFPADKVVLADDLYI